MEGFTGEETCWISRFGWRREGWEGAHTGPRLRCAALLDGSCLWRYSGWCRRAFVVEADKNLVSGVLNASRRFVQFTGGLRGQLAQSVTVCDVGKCPINEIRTHFKSPSSFDRPDAQGKGRCLTRRRSIFYLLDALVHVWEQKTLSGFCCTSGYEYFSAPSIDGTSGGSVRLRLKECGFGCLLPTASEGLQMVARLL